MKNEQTIEEHVLSIIVDVLSVDPQNVQPDKKIADLTTDSIQLFELLLALERTFNSKAKYEDIVQIQTVQDIVDYLSKDITSK
jgi:acyl carrier protein